ncbi:hypothetical protein [Sphingomonas phyllosphaerae]
MQIGDRPAQGAGKPPPFSHTTEMRHVATETIPPNEDCPASK